MMPVMWFANAKIPARLATKLSALFSTATSTFKVSIRLSCYRPTDALEQMNVYVPITSKAILILENMTGIFV